MVWLKRIAIALGVIIVAAIGALFYQARTVAAPPEIGAADGRLTPCPSTPNCVSTQNATLPEQQMPPLTFSDTPEAAQQRLVAAIRAQPRTEILTERPGYVHALFRSPTFGFPDDAEFVIGAGVIDFRAAARMGRSDQGKNREHMQNVANVFAGR